MASKMLHKISCKYDINKILKEYLKLCLANPNRIKAEIMNQIIALLKEQDHRDPADSVSIRDINADRGNASEPAIMTSSQNLLARPGGAGDLVISSNSQNMLVKSLIKLCSDRSNENSQAVTSKLKDLFSVCQRRFGQEFTSKVMANDRAVDLLA